jgi:hypothetical protein
MMIMIDVALVEHSTGIQKPQGAVDRSLSAVNRAG